MCRSAGLIGIDTRYFQDFALCRRSGGGGRRLGGVILTPLLQLLLLRFYLFLLRFGLLLAGFLPVFLRLLVCLFLRRNFLGVSNGRPGQCYTEKDKKRISCYLFHKVTLNGGWLDSTRRDLRREEEILSLDSGGPNPAASAQDDKQRSTVVTANAFQEP